VRFVKRTFYQEEESPFFRGQILSFNTYPLSLSDYPSVKRDFFIVFSTF